ncbi:unnamed protein product [Mytilus coruscus]|uniref:Fibrinogen C-terminal domain-containing protein n=1 Tax=Mytilus coruscus TaxID=42192 RepID=A0A6J8AAA3_MYTCO|nr:unnamed protein product [Mytilus coruscus]
MVGYKDVFKMNKQIKDDIKWILEDTGMCRQEDVLKDCTKLAKTRATSGVYQIFPEQTQGVKVLRWTIIQTRLGGSVNFQRSWTEYQNGFGNVDGEYWLDNKYIHRLTSMGKYELRIDLTDQQDNLKYAKYKTFIVGDASSQYKLTVGEYTGNAGNIEIDTRNTCIIKTNLLNTTLEDLKTLILGVDTKVNKFCEKLDTTEHEFSNLVQEVKQAVTQVKIEVSKRGQEIKELRQDHDELQRGVEAMELNVQSLEAEKLESMRQSFETKLTNLQEQQLLLEKNDRKYNVLVYGMPEKSDENIWAVLDNLMINYLKIDKPKVDSFPLANAHRIPARQNTGERKRPNHIIIRFMHYADKQFFLSHGSNLGGRNIRMVDDLPPCMKDARNELPKIGYKIRSEEKLKTQIRHSGGTVILETHNSSRDQWQIRKEFRCC